MNFKEHLQFLVMMIPTLLLLIAAVVTLAAPTGAPSAAEATSAEHYARHELAGVVDAEAGPLHAVAVR